MQTIFKSSLSIALLFSTSAVSAQQLPIPAHQVPAISSALNGAPSSGVVPEQQQNTAVSVVPLPSTVNQLVTPAPLPKETLSPRVARVRDQFDSRQRAQVAEYISEARQVPTSKGTTHVGGQTVFTYQSGALFTVYVGAGRITDIALQAGEQLTGEVQGGDTVRWMIAQVNSGSEEGDRTHIILKAVDSGLTTDLFIPTNKRTYLITARSVADWHMPSVSWRYPQESWKQQQIAKSLRESVVPVAATPESLYFDYKITSAKRKVAWKPLQVFDDGKQTFIRMPASLNATDAPALFIIENGEPLMVNYRVRGVADGSNGPTYVVDRLFDRAELRVGADKPITIRRR